MIDLVKVYYNVKFPEACQWLAEQFHIGGIVGAAHQKHPARRINRTTSTNCADQNVQQQNVEPDSEILEWIMSVGGLSEIAKEFLFKERLLSEDVVKQCRIIYISDDSRFCTALINRFGEQRCIKSGIIYRTGFGQFRSHFILPAIAFPFYDYDGRLVNIQTRTMYPKRKPDRFRFIRNYPVIPFNLQSLNGLKPVSELYITEGVTDCLAVLSEGKNAIAFPGASSYKSQFDKYLEPYVLMMFPDNDEAGRNLCKTMKQSLKHSVFVQPLPDGVKDYSDVHIRNSK